MSLIFSKRLPLLLTRFNEVLFSNILNSNLRLVTSPLTKIGNGVRFKTSTDYSDFEFKPPKVEEVRKMYKRPVDWLPFEWHRRPRHNPFENSGDLVKELEYDPSWPKPDFELSDELKTASEDVKSLFSLATANRSEIKEAVRRVILKKVQRHPNDLESLEVEIAMRTVKIRSLFHHHYYLRKERRGGRQPLYVMINKRNKKLKMLYRRDRERFNWLIQELKLEYTPAQIGGIKEKYKKKNVLRRLTDEYCKRIIKEKKDKYHEELKQQQADFLKEKEEILAWIEKEEKELENLTV